MAPTIPVFTLDIDKAFRTTTPDELAKGALRQYRAEAARSRSGTSNDLAAISTTIAFLGDSFTEAYNPSVRGLMWPLRVARRLNGPRIGSVTYIPSAASTFSTTTPASGWPGSQAPWTYSSAPAGVVDHGADLHSVTMVSGSTATLTFFGEVVNVYYTRTPGGPVAAAVTLDGSSVAAIAANGTELVGQAATYVADGYGFHTLVITSTSGQLLLEGAVVTDNEVSVIGIPCRMIRTMTFGHAGFDTAAFVGNTNWSQSLANICANTAVGIDLSLAVIGLGANDAGFGRTPAAFGNNLVALLQQIDAAIDARGVTIDPGFLFMAFPTMPDSYIDTIWDVRNLYGTDRVGVLDVRQYLPGKGTGWGIFDAGNGHPNDAGQRWLADLVASFLEGFVQQDQPRPSPHTPGLDVKIDATAPPHFRLAYAENLVSLGTATGLWADQTPASATVAERRHRVWMEQGTYKPALRYGQVTTLGGEWQVLVKGTSLGTTGASTGTDGLVSTSQLSSTIAIDSPGAYPVVIRKTGLNAGAARFVDLTLRKIG